MAPLSADFLATLEQGLSLLELAFDGLDVVPTRVHSPSWASEVDSDAAAVAMRGSLLRLRQELRGGKYFGVVSGESEPGKIVVWPVGACSPAWFDLRRARGGILLATLASRRCGGTC